MITIYALCDSRKPGFWAYPGGYGFDYKPFYIGQTSVSVATRVKQHFHHLDGKVSKRLHRVLETSDLRVEVLFTTEDKEQANGAERDAIKAIGRKDLGEGPLLNAHVGGAAPDISRLKLSSQKAWSRLKAEAKKKRMRPLVQGLERYYERLGKDGRSARGHFIAKRRIDLGSEEARGNSISETKSKAALLSYREKLSPYSHLSVNDVDVLAIGSGKLMPHTCEFHGTYQQARDHVVGNIKKFNEPCRFCIAETTGNRFYQEAIERRSQCQKLKTA